MFFFFLMRFLPDITLLLFLYIYASKVTEAHSEFMEMVIWEAVYANNSYSVILKRKYVVLSIFWNLLGWKHKEKWIIIQFLHGPNFVSQSSGYNLKQIISWWNSLVFFSYQVDWKSNPFWKTFQIRGCLNSLGLLSQLSSDRF